MITVRTGRRRLEPIDFLLNFTDFLVHLRQPLFQGSYAAAGQLSALFESACLIGLRYRIGDSCSLFRLVAPGANFDEAGIANRPQIELVLEQTDRFGGFKLFSVLGRPFFIQVEFIDYIA